MGLILFGAVLAPIVAAAATLDWRARRRRKERLLSRDHRTARRPVEPGLDIGDIGG
jgi:hypothetical protein